MDGGSTPPTSKKKDWIQRNEFGLFLSLVNIIEPCRNERRASAIIILHWCRKQRVRQLKWACRSRWLEAFQLPLVMQTIVHYLINPQKKNSYALSFPRKQLSFICILLIYRILVIEMTTLCLLDVKLSSKNCRWISDQYPFKVIHCINGSSIFLHIFSTNIDIVVEIITFFISEIMRIKSNWIDFII